MREGYPNSRKCEICVYGYHGSYLRTCFLVCVYNQRFSERLNNYIRCNHSRCKSVHRGDAH